jgi:hypothetical protein
MKNTECIANVQNPGSFVGQSCEREATVIVTDRKGREFPMCDRCSQAFVARPEKYTVRSLLSLEERKASITAQLRALGATDDQIASVVETMS